MVAVYSFPFYSINGSRAIRGVYFNILLLIIICAVIYVNDNRKEI